MSDKVLLSVRPPEVGEMLIFRGVVSETPIPNAALLIVSGDRQVRLCAPGSIPSGVIPECYQEIEAMQPFWVCARGPIEIKTAERLLP